MSDKSTVVSFCNFDIGPEIKPRVFPSGHIIPAAPVGEFIVFHVGPAWTDIPMLDEKTIRVDIPSGEVARSLVEDWRNSQLQTGPGAMPGLFYVKAEYDEDDVKANCKNMLTVALGEHTNWCERLVKMADDLWAIKPIHRQIADTMRRAAEFMHVDREWCKVYKPSDMIKCPACQSVISNEVVICRFCQYVVNESAYSEMTFAKR